MKIPNTSFAAALVVLFSLAGCSVLDEKKIDYQTAQKAPSLAVPPDLVQLSKDARYNASALPQGLGAASRSSGNSGTSNGTVANSQVADVRLERNGDQRYLSVVRSADAVWPRLVDFWKQTGFNLTTESPNIGIIETDWAENRAKIPQDIIRRTLGKLVDGLYDSGLRDRYRARIERVGNGSEIFITHRGLEEVNTSTTPGQSNFKWVARPRDVELEEEMLRRLMQYLAGNTSAAGVQAPAASSPTTAKPAAPSNARPAPASAASRNTTNLQAQGAGWAYATNDPSDRAQRRLANALDRAGFTIEEQNRAAGRYTVRYADLPEDSGSGFNFFGSKTSKTQKFDIALQSAGGATNLVLTPQEVNAANTALAQRLLGLLVAQY